MCLYGRIFLPWFLLGILQPHLNCGMGLRPQSQQGQKERMAIGASEKLVQEGLRRNRDRLAAGKRVGSCVRKVAHDLESMRGAGGLLRHYQTDRLVRMAFGTKPGRGHAYRMLAGAHSCLVSPMKMYSTPLFYSAPRVDRANNRRGRRSSQICYRKES